MAAIFLRRAMTLLPKRFVFVGIAFIFLFLLIESQYYGLPNGVTRPVTQYQPPARTQDDAWLWSDREPQFPLEHLVPLPVGGPKQLRPIQHKFGHESSLDRSTRLERQSAVKETFKKCWNSYRTRAWMKDELSPISGGGGNYFGGWSASLVDALDTLWIMDLKDEFEEAVTAAISIDFTTSTDEIINVFETTIRYLGGFLAAYDLSNDVRLLHKAVEIGEMLLVPFDTPNHMPITRWRWKDAKDHKRQEAPSWMLVSELGSLTMEYVRLSQLTGDPRWYDAVDRITRLFAAQQTRTKLPGMWPISVNPKDKDLTSDTAFTLGGMSDSLYEYFPKTHILLGGLESVYEDLYRESMSTASQHLFFRPMTPNQEDILFSGDVRTRDDGSPSTLDSRVQHLGCFVGGMLALGGRIFDLDDHVSMAKKITDGCVWAYNATSVGVMPEITQLVPCSSEASCPWNEEVWEAAVVEKSGSSMEGAELDEFITSKKLPRGYSQIPDSRYILRPEALESVFYMFRITGDRTYMDTAWQMFDAVQHLTQTDFGNAAVRDITASDANGLPPKDDRMESFWLAETLKYAYLIFSEPSLISLDEYVFNTEAHPFKLPT